MSWLNKLFGSTPVQRKIEAPARSEEYNGYIIEATPYRAGSDYQLSGLIRKGEQVHKFVRADRFSDKDTAAEIAISKGKLIIDQLGEAMFRP